MRRTSFDLMLTLALGVITLIGASFGPWAATRPASSSGQAPCVESRAPSADAGGPTVIDGAGVTAPCRRI